MKEMGFDMSRKEWLIIQLTEMQRAGSLLRKKQQCTCGHIHTDTNTTRRGSKSRGKLKVTIVPGRVSLGQIARPSSAR